MDKETLNAYKTMGKEYIKNIDAYTAEEIDDFMEALPDKGRILDVGCAGGRDSEVFADEGFDVVGIDLVEQFLEYAKERVPEATFKKMDANELEFKKESFVGIWADAVLIHQSREEAKEVLADFYELLRPAGCVFLAVKRGKGEGTREDDLVEGVKRHYTYFQKEELEKLLKDVGFKIEFSLTSEDFRKDKDESREDIVWVKVCGRKPE